jgi:FkbM family methyltransferase
MLPPEGRRATSPGRVRRWLAAHTDSWSVRAARALTYRATAVLHTENHDPATNGELRVLRCLGREARVLLDVGAHRGTWALAAAEACPNAVVHCLEIALPTRCELRRRTDGHPQIVVPGHGLLGAPGVARLKHYVADDRLSSVVDYPHELHANWREEPVETGDRYLTQSGIDHVDLLKIDTEGADLLVLQGFGESLSAGRIAAVQFEYGFAAILSGALLERFHALLAPAGYVIGRVLPTRVDFRPYRLSDERFFGPNFLAVRRDRHELVAVLAGRKGGRAPGRGATTR